MKKLEKYMMRKQKVKKKYIHVVLLIIALIVLMAGGSYFFLLSFSPNKLFNPFGKNEKYLILISQLAKKSIDVVYINYLDNDTIEASISSGTKVILSLKNDPLKTVASLQLILTRFRIEGRKVNKIDLRFKNPVVE